SCRHTYPHLHSFPTRRSSDLRHNGKLAASGSVAYLFKKLGVLSFDKATASEDQITEIALDLGAEDVRPSDSTVEVITEPASFERSEEHTSELQSLRHLVCRLL